MLTLKNYTECSCPSARVVDGRSENGVTSVNRVGNQSTACLGPACAGWRWFDPLTQSVTVPQADAVEAKLSADGWVSVGLDGGGLTVFCRVTPGRRAYCGPMGRPDPADLDVTSL